MQQDLFGVKPKVVVRLGIDIDGLDDFAMARITITAHPLAKRDPMQISVTPGGRRSIGATLGMLNSVLHRGYGMDAETIRLDLWRVVKWAGEEGMEVQTRHLGQPPAWRSCTPTNRMA